MESGLLRNIYGKERLESISRPELEEVARTHPYFALAQLFLARKIFAGGEKDGAVTPALQKALLYLDPPLRLLRFLDRKEASLPEKSSAETSIPEKNPAEDRPETVKNQPEPVLPPEELFQPLFARDYFASQGIRLSDTLQNDTRRPTMAELRSFTDWLKTTRRSGQPQAGALLPGMKRMPEEEETAVPEDVERMAAGSIDNREEIVTESMAELWTRQGQPAKAIHIYEKLGLLNPGKSSYFADKISEIKHSNL